MGWYRWEDGDLVLDLSIQPRGSKDEFVAPHGDRFKVRITAPPVDGKANAHLIKFLAKSFGVTKADVSLISGAHSRQKSLRIANPRTLPLSIERP